MKKLVLALVMACMAGSAGAAMASFLTSMDESALTSSEYDSTFGCFKNEVDLFFDPGYTIDTACNFTSLYAAPGTGKWQMALGLGNVFTNVFPVKLGFIFYDNLDYPGTFPFSVFADDGTNAGGQAFGLNGSNNTVQSNASSRRWEGAFRELGAVIGYDAGIPVVFYYYLNMIERRTTATFGVVSNYGLTGAPAAKFFSNQTAYDGTVLYSQAQDYGIGTTDPSIITHLFTLATKINGMRIYLNCGINSVGRLDSGIQSNTTVISNSLSSSTVQTLTSNSFYQQGTIAPAFILPFNGLQPLEQIYFEAGAGMNFGYGLNGTNLIYTLNGAGYGAAATNLVKQIYYSVFSNYNLVPGWLKVEPGLKWSAGDLVVRARIALMGVMSLESYSGYTGSVTTFTSNGAGTTVTVTSNSDSAMTLYNYSKWGFLTSVPVGMEYAINKTVSVRAGLDLGWYFIYTNLTSRTGLGSTDIVTTATNGAVSAVTTNRNALPTAGDYILSGGDGYVSLITPPSVSLGIGFNILDSIRLDLNLTVGTFGLASAEVRWIF